jgi:hypothetical protein
METNAPTKITNPEPLFSPEEMNTIVEAVAPAPKDPAIKPNDPPKPDDQNLPDPDKNKPDDKKDDKPPKDPLFQIPEDVLPKGDKSTKPKPEDRIDPDKIKIEDYPVNARANVGNLRKQMIADHRRITALEKAGIKFEEVNGELVVTGGSAVKMEEYEALKKRAEEQEAILERTNLIASRSFKEKFETPMIQQKKTIYDLAVGLLPDRFKEKASQDGFLAVIDQLSGVPMASRVEYLKKYFPDSVGSFIPLFQKVDEINAGATAALQDWKKTKEQLGTENSLRMSEQTREAKTLMLKAGLEDVSKNGFWMFKRTSGVDEASKKWNAQVDALEQSTAKIFDSDDPKLQTQAIVRGVASEYLLGLATSMQTRIRELEESLAQYETADPSIRGTRKAPDGKREIPASMTPAQAAEALFG